MKIKNNIIALLALAGSAFVAPANAAVTFTAGDLILAVRSATEGQTLMVNLGASAGANGTGGYRNQTTDIPVVVNIGLDLDANFAGWQTRSDVTWSIFGVRANTTIAGDPNNTGDPGQTIYVSRAEVPVGVQETAWGVAGQTITGTNHSAAAGSMVGVQSEFAGGTDTGDPFTNATILLVSQTLYDATATATWGAFVANGGTVGNFGAGTAGTALDLFRSLGTTTGANPTGTVRVGSYEGTFRINDLGVVSYSTTAAAIPEPSRALLLGLGAVGFIFRRRRTPAKA